MNVLTNAMERMTKMAFAADEILEKWGKEAYGQKVATEKELRERFENIQPDEILQLVEQFGKEEVNKMLVKYGKGGQNA